MKPAKFEYHAPRSIEEAVALLDKYGEDARVLAGGQSLTPLLNFRILQPRALISINHCPELAYLEQCENELVCGALIRQAEAERSAMVRQHCPLLAAALPWVGGISNRNRGTVCGSLAHADPLAELTAVAVALDADFVIANKEGQRQVKAEAFFVSDLTTCVEPGEMLKEVRFPRSQNGERAAFVEVGNRWHGFAVVGVAAQFKFSDDGLCETARLAAIGVGSTPIRLSGAEEILVGTNAEGEVLREAGHMASQSVDPPGGFHADAAYRAQVLGTLVERAVEKALGKHPEHRRN